MTVPVVLAIAGVIALFLGVWGGGIKVKEIEIPSASPKGRLFVGILGIGFIGISIWLSVLPLFGSQPDVPKSPTPTDVIVVGVIDTPSPTLTNIPELTNTPASPTLTATPELLPIVGTWKGKTTGTNAGNLISERATTVSIPVDCQLGKDCGFFSTEGACNYQMTLTEVQDNVFIFDTISVSGADFCYGDNPEKTIVKIALVSDAEIFFHYQTPDSVVVRDGTLTK